MYVGGVGRVMAVASILALIWPSYMQAASDAQWVHSPNLSIRIETSGEINGLQSDNGGVLPFRARTTVLGCQDERPPVIAGIIAGGVEIRRTMKCENTAHHVSIAEQLTPTPSSIRWTVTIRSDSKPWSVPLQTVITYGASPSTRFWTAWSNSEQARDDTSCYKDCGKVWLDPLVTAPLRNQLWYYGATTFTRADPGINFTPVRGDLFSIPIATILEPKQNRAISVVFSPEDQILDATMRTTAEGEITWSRLYHRLGNESAVTYSLDLVAHEADWRGGLRWMTERYPSYFNAPLPQTANDVSGEGAYSTYKGPIDVEHLRRIGFRTNWMVGYDFLYMGMYLPPVSVDDRWKRYTELLSAGPNEIVGRYNPDSMAVNGITSIHELADYCSRMRDHGFYAMDYFNATEFGAGMKYPRPPVVIQDPSQIWKDPNDLFYSRMPNAAVINPQTGKPYMTYGDAFVVDPGDPQFQEFLLEQARRLVKYLPASAGLVVDRLDWLRMYNFNRDDGTSWVEGYPAASLHVSWRQFLDRLAPIVHSSGQVIFVNNHDKRLDLLKGVDGIWDEHGSNGESLNTTALLAINRPAIAWTRNDMNLRADPDAFFQRYLYLGVFPTAPYPENDHSLRPSTFADEWYIKYSPLLNVMRGRKWVLAPHAIETSDAVKVNLFTVGESYVVPVMFGGALKNAFVTLHHVENGRYNATVLHPGESEAITFSATAANGDLLLTIPLKRGCGMVKLELTRAK